MLRHLIALAAVLSVVWSAGPTLAQCEPGWLGGFAEPGLSGSGGARVYDILRFESKKGPRVLVAGAFDSISGTRAGGLVERMEERWIPLIQAQPVSVFALEVFDDGSGAAVYAAGRFEFSADGGRAYNIARWDGETWSTVGEGIGRASTASVHSLRVFDDGSGVALYAMGSFDQAGGAPVRNIAKWDGRTWTGVGTGTDTNLDASAVYDDGSGPALYVGGRMREAGGVAVDGIARWDGANWSAVGCVVGMPQPRVSAMTVYNAGDGPALYVGGDFAPQCQAVRDIAKWDGQRWTSIGPAANGDFSDLLGIDEPSGPMLYVSGGFTEVNGRTARGVAKWDGKSWQPVGKGVKWASSAGRGTCLRHVDMGVGKRLYLGGLFDEIDSHPAGGLAEWNGRRWAGLDQGLGNPRAMAVADDGAGRTLFVAGARGLSQPDYQHDVVKWEDGRWRQLPGDFSIISFPWLRALAEFDDGSGPRVMLGGSFRLENPICYNIAAWDGAQWAAVGDGLFGSSVDAMAVFDDGEGPGLYVGGEFTHAGQIEANNIARWGDQRWSRLRLGTNGPVRALFAGDAGEGAGLYVGGTFTTAGQQVVSNLARWNDGWFDVGGGANGTVRALAIFDDGGGPALYLGGEFTEAGGIPANHIARFDGANWSSLGDGVNGVVLSLQVHDDGGGPALYVGGEFTHAGPVEVNGVARWSGGAWTTLADGLEWPGSEPIVRAMASFDDGGGSALWAGGFMRTASGIPSRGIAKWGCPDGAGCEPCDVNCDGVVDAADIDPFIALLLDPNPAPCAPCAGDTNADGLINAFDIEPFVQCLTP